MRKTIPVIVFTLIAAIVLSGCGEEKVSASMYYQQSEELDQAKAAKDVAQKKTGELEKKIAELEEIVRELETKNEVLQSENQSLTEKVDELEHNEFFLLDGVKKAVEVEKWEEAVKLADEIHERYADSNTDYEAANLTARAKDEIARAKAERIAEETREYDTGITAAMLFYNPDIYVDSKVKLSGEVTEIHDTGSIPLLRMMADGYIPVDVEYAADLFEGKEGDTVLVCGTVETADLSIDFSSGNQTVVPRIMAEIFY